MYVVVGLGNYGREYERTRHNAGFDVAELLADRHNIAINKSKCQCKLGEGIIGGERTAICLPQTYMNLSGQAVVQLLNWYKVPHDRLIVIYDDIDLPLGRIRVRAEGSAGTHNGMRNIIYLTGAQDFPRVRVGIGAPEGGDLRNFVTGHYRKEEYEAAFAAYKRASEAVEAIMKDGVERAMAAFNPVKKEEDRKD